MSLLRLNQVSLHYGEQVLLDTVELQLEPGERVCLVGRNGVGKSTFLRVVEGSIKPDGGAVWQQPGLKVARLEQEPNLMPGRTVYDEVASGLAELSEVLAAYHHPTHAVGEMDLKKLETSAAPARRGRWLAFSAASRNRIEPASTHGGTTAGATVRRLAAPGGAGAGSGAGPDLLLLDEPTNHLDIEAIDWLEGQLLSSPAASCSSPTTTLWRAGWQPA